MRSLTALSAFLDVSSLNLAAPQASPFFWRWQAQACGSGAPGGPREAGDQPGDRAAPPRTGESLDPALVHVEFARDLDLQRMYALARPAVVAGDVAAGVGVVAAHA